MDNNYKKRILNSVSRYLKEKDFVRIKAKLPGMESPEMITEEKSGITYQPDLTATYNDGLHIFELETGESLKSRKSSFIKKCKNFENIVASEGGKVHLVIPIERFDLIKTFLNTHNLENISVLQYQSTKSDI